MWMENEKEARVEEKKEFIDKEIKIVDIIQDEIEEQIE